MCTRNGLSLGSAFIRNSTKQETVKKWKKGLPKSSGKRSKVLNQIASKFNIWNKVENPRGHKKDHLNKHKLKTVKES